MVEPIDKERLWSLYGEALGCILRNEGIKVGGCPVKIGHKIKLRGGRNG